MLQINNKKFLRVVIVVLLYCYIAILLWPFSSQAATSGSENYQATDNLKFGGGKMDSQNYSVDGFLTDVGEQVLWDTAGAVPSDEKKIGIPPVIDKNKLIPIGPGGENILLEKIGQINILGNLNLDQLAKKLDIPLMMVVAALTLASLAIPLLLNIPLLAPFANIWSRILGFFGYYKKKEEKWGVVYDAETKKPIPLAVVQIFEPEYNKLLNTQITDKDGRFSFLVEPGKYYLKATKKNYLFPSKIESDGYHGNEIVLVSSEIINYNIPLDPQVKTLAHRIQILAGLGNFFNIIRIPLLIFGTLVTSYIYLNYSGTLNFVFLILYAIVWILEFFRMRQAKPVGKTFDEISRTPLDLTILRLFNEKNKLVSTKVSDGQGRFSFLINPGEYYLTALKQDYNLYKTKNLQYSRAASIDLEIGLRKHMENIIPPKTEQAPITENLAPKPIINPEPAKKFDFWKDVIPDRKAATATDPDQESKNRSKLNQQKEIEFPKIKIQPETKQIVPETKPIDNNQENLYNLHSNNTSPKPFWEPRRI